VGGTLDLSPLTQAQVAAAFPALRNVGTLRLVGNDEITNIFSLTLELRQVDAVVVENSALQGIAMEFRPEVFGSITVRNNLSFQGFNIFGSAEQPLTIGDVVVEDCPELRSISLRDVVRVSNMEVRRSARSDGNALQFFGCGLRHAGAVVFENTTLIDVAGYGELVSATALTFQNNARLPQCQVTALANALSPPVVPINTGNLSTPSTCPRATAICDGEP
jgi:hypothetical protein